MGQFGELGRSTEDDAWEFEAVLGWKLIYWRRRGVECPSPVATQIESQQSESVKTREDHRTVDALTYARSRKQTQPQAERQFMSLLLLVKKVEDDMLR